MFFWTLYRCLKMNLVLYQQVEKYFCTKSRKKNQLNIITIKTHFSFDLNVSKSNNNEKWFKRP